MKICPNCHAQLDDSSIFCTSCGTQFGAVPPQQNEVPPQQSAVPPQQNAIPPQQNAVPPQPAFAPAYDPYDHTAEFDPKDISDNKFFCYALLPYGFYRHHCCPPRNSLIKVHNVPCKTGS